MTKNKNNNLHLNLNRQDFNPTPNGSFNSIPFTPIDQTVSTPLEAPALPHPYQHPHHPHHPQPPPLKHQTLYSFYQAPSAPAAPAAPVAQQQQQQQQPSSLYQHPTHNESDDILTDIDEPLSCGVSRCNTQSRNYSINNNTGNLPMSNGLKNSSISNLSLNEMNVMHYNLQSQQQHQQQQQQQNAAALAARSRSSLVNLRKQSLTRNNSNNWLHVGNIYNLRPHGPNAPHGSTGISGQAEFNVSTDSLMDYVPQTMINRTSNGNGGGPYSQLPQLQTNIINGHLNSMMMDHHIDNTPPASHRGSINSTGSPVSQQFQPQQQQLQQLQQLQQQQQQPSQYDASFQNPNDIYANLRRNKSSSSTMSSSSSLRVNSHLQNSINMESANIQALNALNGRSGSSSISSQTSTNSNNNNNNYYGSGLALDSPFLSATTPGEEYFGSASGVSTPQQLQQQIPEDGECEKVNIPAHVSLNEKKRDSLKLKRGIH